MGLAAVGQLMKPTLCLLSLFALIIAIKAIVLPGQVIAVSPPPISTPTIARGRGWAYTVAFPVTNLETIEKLIQCESQGVNVARLDSNHVISWGLLQFNGTSTWDEAEAKFGFYGSPLIPSDAIHMADLMISGGELGRWTCAHLLQLRS